MSRTRLSLVAGLLLGPAMLWLAAACADERGANASAPAATTPQAAIAALVESQGQRYAGPCEQTRSPDDVGKVCSKLIETRAGVEAHLTGRTFSEFDTWVFVSQSDGSWNIIATARLDFFDTTGTIPWPR
jgi:hypothetical protein